MARIIGIGIIGMGWMGEVHSRAYPAILAELKELNYQGWIVVEQDVLPGLSSPKASARRNRDYLKSIGV